MDAITFLDTLLSTNEILIVIAVAAVAFVGLVMEYTYSDRTESLAVSSLGAFLVAMGVAGEFGLHLRSSEIVDEVSEIHRAIVTSQQKAIVDITRQAAHAKKRAESAEERAATANAENADANDMAAKANERAAKSQPAPETELATHQGR